MAFSYTIEQSIMMNPSNERKSESGTIVLMWGSFTNSGGGTGGAIVTLGSDCYFFSATDENAAPAVIVTDRTTTAGTVTITTTADHSARWMAKVRKS